MSVPPISPRNENPKTTDSQKPTNKLLDLSAKTGHTFEVQQKPIDAEKVRAYSAEQPRKLSSRATTQYTPDSPELSKSQPLRIGKISPKNDFPDSPLLVPKTPSQDMAPLELSRAAYTQYTPNSPELPSKPRLSQSSDSKVVADSPQAVAALEPLNLHFPS